MKYIECPNIPKFGEKTLFLAGSISNAGYWQDKMVSMLKDTELTLLNPRRSNFDVNDRAMEVEQIEWESKHLHECEAILYWFSYETLAPITLFEYGVHLGQAGLLETLHYGGKKIFCGIHPEYQRKRDVEVQTRLIKERYGYSINIVYSLQDLANQVINWSK